MTRLSTNSRLQYDPGHRETPIEGIGGLYRFWKSIGSEDRDKLVELVEFGHRNPGEGEPDTSRMDWEALAKDQKDAYENGYDGPVELMNKGWDYAIDDALNRKVQSPTEKLANQKRGTESTDTDSASETAAAESDNTDSAQETSDSTAGDYDWDKHLAAIKTLAEMGDESRRAHAQAAGWRVGNDNRWTQPLLADADGNRLVWPVAPFDDADLNAEKLADTAYQSERSGHRRSYYGA